MGGLGNQLFQIFTVLAHAQRTGQSPLFAFSTFLEIGTIRKTYWNSFLLYLKPYLTKYDLLNYRTYEEIGFEFSSLPNFTENTILHGYFQSYKYFDNELQWILDTICLTRQQDQTRKKYADLLEDSVSLHFRLGDYKESQDRHPLMPYAYYETALDYIVNQRSTNKVLYFCQSQDNEAVADLIQQLSERFTNLNFLKIDDSIVDWKQLILMSCCQNNIIANSTFGWWGAYFNANPRKIICYPDKWFGPTLPYDTSDLFPDSWHKIV